MISEWPIRPDAPKPAPDAAPSEPCAFLRPATSTTRLIGATTDLFLPQAHRLSDRVRAFVTTMLNDLAGGVERDIRLAIAPHFADKEELVASLSSASAEIALPLLLDAGTLAHPPLVAILLRRAEEFVLSDRLSPGEQKNPLTQDSDQAVAAAATALLVANARRVDRFGAPALLLDDLPAELAHWLVWHVAAALRHYLRAHHAVDDSHADAVLVPAARNVLAAHDEGRGLHATAFRLAARLAANDRIDGPLLNTLLTGGNVPAFVAALASLTALPHEDVWHIVADPSDGRLAVLLRAAGTDRDAAAAILLLLTRDATAEIDVFDSCGQAAAAAALASLALEPQYRAAITEIDTALAAAEARA